ncbi:MAG: tyrosine-type recombinase/integrase [Pseudomonadota bacterium]
MSTDFEHTLAQQDALSETRRDVVSKRRDFQPQIQPPGLNATRHTKGSHTEKMHRYRDRLLSALNGRIDPELFLRLDERTQVRLGSIAPNTEINQYADLCGYVEYCVREQLIPFPVSDHGLDAYLSHRMAEGLKRSTLDRCVASLATWHKVCELDDPRLSFAVQARIDKLKQVSASRPHQKEGLRGHHLVQAIAVHDPDVLRDAADLALLFTAFETLCRRSELSALSWTDLTIEPSDGSGLLFIADSKTDKDKEGDYQYISPVTVQLLNYWQRQSGQSKGAVFRGIYSDGRLGTRLSHLGVARAFKRIAKKISIDPSMIGGHSTRVGAAQEMVEQDIDAAKIMLAGRWSSLKMVTHYSKRINAKKGGMAELTSQLGWQPEKLLEAFSTNE